MPRVVMDQSPKDLSVLDLLPSCSASVEGVFVGTLSPGRKNPNVKYFKGQLSDGCKTVRSVSFEPRLRPQIEEAQGKSAAVLLRNCAIKGIENKPWKFRSIAKPK